MSRYEDGEYMPLYWDDSPDAYYIKGHVTHAEGMLILDDAGMIYDDMPIGQARQMYGRWSTEPGEDGYRHVLRTYKNPGRGRFKVTEFGLGCFAKSSASN